jgi:hypothetical protein
LGLVETSREARGGDAAQARQTGCNGFEQLFTRECDQCCHLQRVFRFRSLTGIKVFEARLELLPSESHQGVLSLP